MRLSEIIVKEYFSLIEVLVKTEGVEDGRIVIDKEVFRGLLEKYKYLAFTQKTKIYKEFNLVIHDKGNYTMPYRDKDTGKITRKVILNYKAYKILKDIYEKEYDIE